mmetsp:Transcript_12504/g.30365  ORF Transcript_12504/g.30365 Transcript_12504/m.30365 type:complete len:236 (-) Transcript_12504:1306-2013(-)
MRHHCGPMPLYTKRLFPAVALPLASAACVAPFAWSRRAVMAPARSEAATTSRSGKCERPRASVCPISRRGVSGFLSRKSASRVLIELREACDMAHSGSSCVVSSPPCAARAPASNLARIAWALVPPYPNEFTATKGASDGRGVALTHTSTLCSPKGIARLREVKDRCGNITPVCRISAALMNPTMPAAASRWEMFVLIEPMSTGPWRPSAPPYTAPIAAASSGSPTRVPVPCAST